MAANPILRAYTLAGTIAGPQEPAPLDWLPFAAATIGVFPLGTAVYSVEFTLDPLNLADGTANPNVRWFTLDDMPIGSTGVQYSVIYYPFQALRLNIASLDNTIEFKIVQSSTGRY